MEILRRSVEILEISFLFLAAFSWSIHQRTQLRQTLDMSIDMSTGVLKRCRQFVVLNKKRSSFPRLPPSPTPQLLEIKVNYIIEKI